MSMLSGKIVVGVTKSVSSTGTTEIEPTTESFQFVEDVVNNSLHLSQVSIFTVNFLVERGLSLGNSPRNLKRSVIRVFHSTTGSIRGLKLVTETC